MTHAIPTHMALKTSYTGISFFIRGGCNPNPVKVSELNIDIILFVNMLPSIYTTAVVKLYPLYLYLQSHSNYYQRKYVSNKFTPIFRMYIF